MNQKIEPYRRRLSLVRINFTTCSARLESLARTAHGERASSAEQSDLWMVRLSTLNGTHFRSVSNCSPQWTKKIKSPQSRLFATVSFALDYYYYILLLVSITPSDRAFWKESLEKFGAGISRLIFQSRSRRDRDIWFIIVSSFEPKVVEANSEAGRWMIPAIWSRAAVQTVWQCSFFRLRILKIEGKKSVAICLSMGDRTIVHANISGITVDNTYYHGWWRRLNMGSLSWSKTQREWWVWGFRTRWDSHALIALSLLLAYLTAWLNSLE